MEKYFITDAQELQDEVLIRKIMECRRQLHQLSAYRSKEIKRASEKLARVVAALEAEAKQRKLPVARSQAFSGDGFIEA